MEKYHLEIIFILILILANGFFASSEIALISARKTRIKQLAEKGNKKARLVEELQSHPDKFLATIQIGITLMATLASVVGGAKIVDVLKPLVQKIPIEWVQNGSEPIAIGLVVVAIAYLSLVIGELVPKYLALTYPEKIAFGVATPIRILSRLSFVIVKILSFSSKVITSIFLRRIPQESSFIGEEEVKYIISEGGKAGIFDETEQELIHSAFEFTDTYVHNIMTPRTEIVALDINSSQEKVVRTITESGFSRIPVYKDNLDNIVGIIYAKDILNLWQHQNLIILEDIIRKPYFVPDSKKISELLKEFQKLKIHVALVLDEFGGTAGLVTLEDIIEEIFGEIEDEYDIERPKIEILSDGSALVSPNLAIGDFNYQMKTNLPEDKADTLGGYIQTSLGRIPATDEEIELDGLTFVIFEKSGHRLKRLKVIQPKKTEEGDVREHN